LSAFNVSFNDLQGEESSNKHPRLSTMHHTFQGILGCAEVSKIDYVPERPLKGSNISTTPLKSLHA
jgi:hypothetical protein